MLIKMLSRQQGSINGRDLEWFEEGQEYNLPLSLAKDFVAVGWAVEVKEESKPTVGPGESKPSNSKRKTKA